MKGNLAEVDAPAVLEIARQMPGMVVVHLTAPEGEGVVYVGEEQIIHAKLGEVEGLDALAGMLGWVEGSFSIENVSDAPPHTIDGEWNAVLLEALRRMDMGEETEAAEENVEKAPSSLSHRVEQLAAVLEGTSFDDAAVVSRDGLLLASTPALAEAEADLLGAVAASIFSLGVRSVDQLHRGSLERGLVQASEANIVVSKINEDMVFIGVAASTVSLGILFAETRTAVRKLDTLLGH